MRYFAIEFLDKNATPGFMEVDDSGNLVRLTDASGKTLDALPDQSYRTLETKEAAKPLWGK